MLHHKLESVSFLHTGYGVFAKKLYSKREFLLEYDGELLPAKEGYKREKEYPEERGSFLYFFRDQGRSYWYVVILFCLALKYYNKFVSQNFNHAMPLKINSNGLNNSHMM